MNLNLKEHGYFMGGFPYIMDDKYKGWSTEEVYDDLNKNGGKPNPNNPLAGDVMPCPDSDVAKAVGKVVAAVSTAKMSGAKPGDIPGEVTIIIDRFLNPKLPWQTLLFNFFNALTSQEYSYRRLNRRFDDPILPGLTGRNGLEHLVYFLDVSGSIMDEHILRFNSEVKFIQEELQPERLTLITFDHVIQDIYEFEREDPFEKIVVTGRGGTSLHEPFEWIRSNAPTAAIIFTDLEVNIPPNPGIPIIWVCIDNPSQTVPYGQLIHIKD